jgi:small conductance mechanosensitive channel
MDTNLSVDVKPSISVEEAEEVLLKTVSEHPKVLEEPAPIVRMDELTENGYKIICWPWVKTVDANEARWDIVRDAQSKLSMDLSEEAA